jgi:hypothetical protein
MRKIPSIFIRDIKTKKIIPKIRPENNWLFSETVLPTQKFDGAACAIIDGKLYKRYDVKKGKKVPENAIPCQQPDIVTGHHPHWVMCKTNDPQDKYFWRGFNNLKHKHNGTYELCGEKINGNPERINDHALLRHGSIILNDFNLLDGVNDHLKDRDEYIFKKIKDYLNTKNIEGIVFYSNSNDKNFRLMMAKIKKKDFGLKRDTKVYF